MQCSITPECTCHPETVGDKSTWPFKANIQPILRALGESPDVNQVLAASKEIAEVLRRGVPKNWLDYQQDNHDQDLEEIVHRLENLTVTELTTKATPAEAFADWVLNYLTEWADEAAVWLGD